MDEKRNPYESIEMLEELGLPVSAEQRMEAREAESEYIRRDLVPEIKEALGKVLKSVHQSVNFTVKYMPGKGIEVEQQPFAQEENDILLLRKIVDKSVLYQGFTVPVKAHEAFLTHIGGHLEHGTLTAVKVLFEGQIYDCKFYNIGFDQEKYDKHSRILQFRWSDAEPLCQHIQRVFRRTKEYIDEARKNRQPGQRMFVTIPDDLQEYLEIYATGTMFEFRFVART